MMSSTAARVGLGAQHARVRSTCCDEAAVGEAVAAEQQVVDHRRVLEQLDVLERARDAVFDDAVARHAA